MGWKSGLEVGLALGVGLFGYFSGMGVGEYFSSKGKAELIRAQTQQQILTAPVSLASEDRNNNGLDDIVLQYSDGREITIYINKGEQGELIYSLDRDSK